MTYATEIVVREVRRPRGDAGPCAHKDCDRRAEHILIVMVRDVLVTTWLCAEHFHDFDREA